MSTTVLKASGTRRAKAPVLQLAPRFSNRDTETAKALRQMAEMAERGEIIGLAYVVLRPSRRVTIGTVGVADNDPSLVTHWLQKLNLILLQGRT